MTASYLALVRLRPARRLIYALSAASASSGLVSLTVLLAVHQATRSYAAGGLAVGALADTSPNKQRSQRFVEFVKGVNKRDAAPVARLIADIAANPNPRLRYRIGGDAHLQVWLKRLLPWRTYEKFIARAVKID